MNQRTKREGQIQTVWVTDWREQSVGENNIAQVKTRHYYFFITSITGSTNFLLTEMLIPTLADITTEFLKIISLRKIFRLAAERWVLAEPVSIFSYCVECKGSNTGRQQLLRQVSLCYLRPVKIYFWTKFFGLFNKNVPSLSHCQHPFSIFVHNNIHLYHSHKI